MVNSTNNCTRLESLQNARGRMFCLLNVPRINMYFFEVFVHPTLSRQKISRLDFPNMLVCTRRILNAPGRAFVGTINFPVWLIIRVS